MIFPITGVHTKILVRLRIEERAVGVGDEIPPESPLWQRGKRAARGDLYANAKKQQNCPKIDMHPDH